MKAFVELVTNGGLIGATVQSLGRVLVGFAFALVVGVSLGALMGSSVPLKNNLDPIIESFRFAFLGGGIVEIWHLAVSAVLTAILLFIGLVMFSRAEKTFMDTI